MKSCRGTFLGNSYFVFVFIFLSCPGKKKGKKKKIKGKYKYKLFEFYYLRNKKKKKGKKIGSGSGRLYRPFFPSDVPDKREKNSGPVFSNVSLIPSPEIDPQNPQIFPPNLTLTTSYPPITRAPFDTWVVWSQLALTYRPSACPSWLSSCAGALWSSQSLASKISTERN
jgi:hypothetical protein